MSTTMRAVRPMRACTVATVRYDSCVVNDFWERTTDMQLEGIHHVTAITGDAPRNVDFYTRVLGLRMAAKTVNQDDPTVYHLFYADELDFWAQRLAAEGVATERAGDRLRFEDFEGLGHELVVDASADEPLAAEHPEVPPEF